MKTIVSNHEVAHLWNAQGQPEARNSSGSVSFHGPRLLSYSTQIGLLLSAPTSCNRWAVLDCTSFSNSTSKHQSNAWRAVRNRTVLSFRHVGERGQYFATPEDVRYLIAKELSALFSVFQSAKMAPRRADTLSAVVAFASEGRKFTDAFLVSPVGMPEGFPTDTEAAAILTLGAEALQRKSAKEAATRAKREAQALLTIAEKLDAWRAGEAISLPRSSTIFLRLRTDGDRQIVETSWGARVFLRDAARLFQAAHVCHLKGLSFVNDGSKVFSVGPYTLDSIDTEGNAKVGCHALSYSEMSLLASAIGEDALRAARGSMEVSA